MISDRDESKFSQFQKSIRISEDIDVESDFEEKHEKEPMKDKNSFAD